MENHNTNIHLLKKHLGGLFLTVAGLLSGYYFIYLTIEKIKSGNNIDFSYKGILIGPALFVIGMYLLVFTNGGKFSIQNLSSNKKNVFYFALLLGLTLGCLALYWVSYNLEIYGYDTSKL
jgi:uncharacterized membrane protein